MQIIIFIILTAIADQSSAQPTTLSPTTINHLLIALVIYIFCVIQLLTLHRDVCQIALVGGLLLV